MTEIKLQKHGHDVAVTIFGGTELEIEQTHWSFFNHGATSSELAWNHDRTNAYFWVCHNKAMTGLEKFERAFTNICLFKILNENSSTSVSNNSSADNLIGEDDSTSVGESILLENEADTGQPQYLISEDYIIGDGDTDKTVQNELFETLDDSVLDFSETNPFGDVGS